MLILLIYPTEKCGCPFFYKKLLGFLRVFPGCDSTSPARCFEKYLTRTSPLSCTRIFWGVAKLGTELAQVRFRDLKKSTAHFYLVLE